MQIKLDVRERKTTELGFVLGTKDIFSLSGFTSDNCLQMITYILLLKEQYRHLFYDYLLRMEEKKSKRCFLKVYFFINAQQQKPKKTCRSYYYMRSEVHGPCKEWIDYFPVNWH